MKVGKKFILKKDDLRCSSHNIDYYKPGNIFIYKHRGLYDKIAYFQHETREDCGIGIIEREITKYFDILEEENKGHRLTTLFR